METWSVDRAVPVEPSTQTYDAAYVLKLSYAEGAEQAEVLVEFEAVSSVASGGYAEEVLRPYLSDDEPPQRVVVHSDGTVEVTARTADDAPERTRRRRDSELPQRARRRGRG